MGNADLAGNIFNFFPWCAEWRVPVRERCSVIFKINLHKAYRRHNSPYGEWIYKVIKMFDRKKSIKSAI